MLISKQIMVAIGEFYNGFREVREIWNADELPETIDVECFDESRGVKIKFTLPVNPAQLEATHIPQAEPQLTA